MVLPVVASAARRRVGMAAAQQQKRSMGSGPAPEWTGIDKVVRDVFPGDHQRKTIVIVVVIVCLFLFVVVLGDHAPRSHPVLADNCNEFPLFDLFPQTILTNNCFSFFLYSLSIANNNNDGTKIMNSCFGDYGRICWSLHSVQDWRSHRRKEKG